jgi:uncharacterized membrane protein
MQLSPEERRRVYEEEKSRIDAEEKKEKDSSTTSLSPNVAGLLCYVGGWITGIVFLVLEQKNRFVRFHAAQSIIVFGTLNIIHLLLNPIPVVGWFFSTMVGVLAFVLWIVLMVKAYHGELFKLPLAGELAERLLGLPQGEMRKEYTGPTKPETAPLGAAMKPTEEGKRRRENRWKRTRAGRIISSGFAIAWSFALLIFFNFFNQYIAFYNHETVGNVSVWVREPILTGEFSSWLPILTVALVFSMLGHAMLIAIDKYVLREATLLILDLFGIAVVTSLLSIFPFDFSALPNAVLAGGMELGIRITLGLITFGIGIAVIVRLIKLTVNLVKGVANE